MNVWHLLLNTHVTCHIWGSIYTSYMRFTARLFAVIQPVAKANPWESKTDHDVMEKLSSPPMITPPTIGINRHYCVDILVLTIGYIPESGFGVTWWGPNDPISNTIENRFKKNSGGCLGIIVICPMENEDLRWDCARKDMMYPCDDGWRHNGVPAGRILVYAGRGKWCIQGAAWCWTNGLCQLEGALKSKSIGVQVFGMFIFLQ